MFGGWKNICQPDGMWMKALLVITPGQKKKLTPGKTEGVPTLCVRYQPGWLTLQPLTADPGPLCLRVECFPHSAINSRIYRSP